MSFALDRVVDVSGASFGSGYLIADSLVLTSAHVAGDGACSVRRLDLLDPIPASHLWRDEESDVAVLRLADIPLGPLHVRLARFATSQPADCYSVGFPRMQVEERSESEELRARTSPLSNQRGGGLALDVTSSAPPQANGWAGMSGAAVFCGPHLVAVVRRVGSGDRPDRIVAVPVESIWDRADLRKALAAHGELPPLESVEDTAPRHAALEPPYPPQRGLGEQRILGGRVDHFPFRRRGDELADLNAWCEGAADVELRLLTGPKGIGKTRLAAQLCRELERKGWVTGFLRTHLDADWAATLARTSAPLCVVIDEAHGRRGELHALLDAIALSSSVAPVRVLLLSRESGEWWERLTVGASHDGGALALLSRSRNSIRPVGPVETTNEGRFEALRAAVALVGDAAEVQETMVRRLRLEDRQYDSFLFVLMAALSVAEGKLPDSDGDGRGLRADLIRFARDRERCLWVETARTFGLDGDDEYLLDAAVAVSILTEAANRREAVAALAALPGLGDPAHAALRERLAAWLHDLRLRSVAGDHWFGAIGPDVLTEAHVAAVLESTSGENLAAELLDARWSDEQRRRTLTVMNLAARDHRIVRERLAAAVRDELSTLWPLAVEVALATGDPLGIVLAEACVARPDAVDPEALVAEIPQRTVALLETALVAARQLRDRLISADPKTSAELARVAEVERQLSRWARKSGRHQEALDAIERACEILRALVAADARYESDYAKALNLRSVRLARADQHRPALASVREAVEIRERLARDDPRHRAGLAESISTLAARLRDAGELEPAFDAAERALALRRELLDTDRERFEPLLARSLTIVCNRRIDMSQPEAALAAVEEALDIRRRMTAQSPDAHEPDLAASLSAYASRLDDLRRAGGPDRRIEALSAIVESVEIRRRLARARPEAFAPDLARSLNGLSNRLAALGRNEEALAAARESLDLRLAIDRDEPGALGEQLPSSLRVTSRRLRTLGRDAEAVPLLDRAVVELERLVSERPARIGPELARTLRLRAKALDTIGDAQKAAADRAAADRWPDVVSDEL